MSARRYNTRTVTNTQSMTTTVYNCSGYNLSFYTALTRNSTHQLTWTVDAKPTAVLANDATGSESAQMLVTGADLVWGVAGWTGPLSCPTGQIGAGSLEEGVSACVVRGKTASEPQRLVHGCSDGCGGPGCADRCKTLDPATDEWADCIAVCETPLVFDGKLVAKVAGVGVIVLLALLVLYLVTRAR